MHSSVPCYQMQRILGSPAGFKGFSDGVLRRTVRSVNEYLMGFLKLVVYFLQQIPESDEIIPFSLEFLLKKVVINQDQLTMSWWAQWCQYLTLLTIGLFVVLGCGTWGLGGCPTNPSFSRQWSTPTISYWNFPLPKRIFLTYARHI